MSATSCASLKTIFKNDCCGATDLQNTISNWTLFRQPDFDFDWNPTFPPSDILQHNPQTLASWFKHNLPVMKSPLTHTPRERQMAKWGVADFIEARKQNQVTCVEYTTLLIRRVRHYKYMNHFVHWETDPDWTEKVLVQAMHLDAIAQNDTSKIGPFYCLPVAIKDFYESTEFPTSYGVRQLMKNYSPNDQIIIQTIRNKHGIIFGKTNMAPMGLYGSTLTPWYGTALNPHDTQLSTAGSSGGSAGAVATHLVPVAIANDIGGSTRMPAQLTGLFSNDPTGRKYRMPGYTDIMSTTGIMVRSMRDLNYFEDIYFDHIRQIVNRQIRVGTPKHQFVYECHERGSVHEFVKLIIESSRPMYCDTQKLAPSKSSMEALQLATDVLRSSSNVIIVDEEWENASEFDKAWVESTPRQSSLPPWMHALGTPHWVAGFLNKVNPSSTRFFNYMDVEDDLYQFGLPGLSSYTRLDFGNFETFLWAIAHQRDACQIWNTYFDKHDVDVLLIPGQKNNPTYECGVTQTCEMQVLNVSDGSLHTEYAYPPFTFFMSFVKIIKFPKVTVPLRIKDGIPQSVQFVGRCGLKGDTAYSWQYDDSEFDTMDNEFMTIVEKLVQELEANGLGYRVPASLDI